MDELFQRLRMQVLRAKLSLCRIEVIRLMREVQAAETAPDIRSAALRRIANLRVLIWEIEQELASSD